MRQQAKGSGAPGGLRPHGGAAAAAGVLRLLSPLPALPWVCSFRFRLPGYGLSGGGDDGGGLVLLCLLFFFILLLFLLLLLGGGRGLPGGPGGGGSGRAGLERLPVPALLLRDAADPAAQPQRPPR